jgi:hypothetical protein
MQGKARNTGISDEAAPRAGQPVRGLSSGKIRMENAEHPTSTGAKCSGGENIPAAGAPQRGGGAAETKSPGSLFDDRFWRTQIVSRGLDRMLRAVSSRGGARINAYYDQSNADFSSKKTP